MDLRTHILNRVDAKEFYKAVLKAETETNVLCPFHDDNNPSLHLRDDGSAHCYGCNRSWKNIIRFYQDLNKVSYGVALYHLFSKFIDPLVSRKKYMSMYANLSSNPITTEWLVNRGIGRKTYRRFLMGYDDFTDRISLPIFNEWGYCVNLRLFRYRRSKNKYNSFKVMSFKKEYGKPRLFPLQSLYHKEVYIFEGEMDALLAIHLGLAAITMTGSSTSWRREFTPLFKDKIVYICMDNDTAGQKGAKIVGKELRGIANKVYNVIIPKKFGKDFTDYMSSRPIEAFLDIVSATREITPDDVKDIKRLKEIEEFSQEETMIAEITPKKQTLHVIVRIVDLDTSGK